MAGNVRFVKSLFKFCSGYFESYFRGCFSGFARRIAGYLTSEIGKRDRKGTQKRPDKIT